MRKNFSLLLGAMLLFSLTHTYAQISIPTTVDSLQPLVIIDIVVTGNKKTKSYIVTRDITFAKEDTIVHKDLMAILDRSQKNIFNTGLFNDVKIDIIPVANKPTDCIAKITVKERWYIIPAPVFQLYDRNYKEWVNVYNKDLNRIKYGLKFKHYNFSGRRDELRINLVNGFSKELSIRYTQPYADKKLQHGFGFFLGYSKRIGVSYIDSLNTGLPRQLCTTCPRPDNRLFVQEDYAAYINYTYRKGIYDRHFASIGYVSTRVADTIVTLNNNYFFNGVRKINLVDANYSYSFYKLDYSPYPLIGQYYTAGLRVRFSKDGLNQGMLFAYGGKYFKLLPKLYLSTQASSSLKIAQHQQSFYNAKTSNLEIGNIRGLEQYLIFSNWDISSRNTLRFQLLKTNFKLPIKVATINYVPLRLFIRGFADFAYAQLNQTNYSVLNNKLLRTAGFGIDLITIYDITIKVDFSFNQFGQFSVFFK
jgi:Surface antigen variable number repeat